MLSKSWPFHRILVPGMVCNRQLASSRVALATLAAPVTVKRASHCISFGWLCIHLSACGARAVIMREKQGFEHSGQDGQVSTRVGTQTGEIPRDPTHDIRQGREDKRSEKRENRTICVVCPYCDGENILQNVSPTHKGGAGEIACRHCQCLFTPSRGARSLPQKDVRSSDRAA